jgi:myo-inositol-1(or 4)-monophosphatase
MSDLRELLLGAATAIRNTVLSERNRTVLRSVRHDSPSGDAQFGIDELAESASWDYLSSSGARLAVYTEDSPLRFTAPDVEDVLIIDPIDGSRPAAAGLESAMISIAAAPYSADATLGEVHSALLMELRSGAWIRSGRSGAIESSGFLGAVPALSAVDDLERMFWSFELNGHPMALMTGAYGHLVDRSANTGGLFIFNSATFSISRILTGQLDAYVDIGNRILRDDPRTESKFLAAGRGRILHLFPYDIAAAVTIARRAGVVITDAYGVDLSQTRLLDLHESNQRSCIAASNLRLHKLLIDSIHWPRVSSATPTTEQLT